MALMQVSGRRHTHGDLHRQQSLAGVFGVDGELHGEGGGHSSGVETRSAGPHLTGVVGGKHFDLVGAAGVQRRTERVLKMER